MKLKAKLVFTTLLLSVAIGSIAQSTLSVKENGKSLQLFKAKKLKQWQEIKSDTSSYKPAVFVSENDILRASGSTPAYLVTKQVFSTFYLSLEFRWNTDSIAPRINNKKNSGVMYCVPVGKDEIWPKGIQFQIKEKSTGDFVLLKDVTLEVNGQLSAPGKSVVIKKIAEAEKPFGEWNTLEIQFENGVVSQYLNGVLVNKGISASVQEGRILLQYEGYPIDFRNISIKYFELK